MLTPQDRLEELFTTPKSFNDTADDLGLSPEELEDKIDGKTDFLSGEIKAIARRFHLNSKEILDIFFPQPLQETVIENITALNGDEYYQIEYLATLANINAQDLLYKMLNEKDFTISDLEKIAQALNKPAEYFLQRHF